LPDVRLDFGLLVALCMTYDHYGIGHTDTITRCWYVVDAIKKHPRSAIKYLDDHGVQHFITDGFHKVSGANFPCFTEAIDGILIWIHRPSDKDCEEVGRSPGKLMCGWKEKRWLKCQAVCNVRGCLLNILIVYQQGTTSDCLAFKGMTLFKNESGHFGFRIVIFSDHAYLNTPYMATPYAVVKFLPLAVANTN
jgi:hypothetical protein